LLLNWGKQTLQNVLYIFIIQSVQLGQKSILAPEKLLATTVATALYCDVIV